MAVATLALRFSDLVDGGCEGDCCCAGGVPVVVLVVLAAASKGTNVALLGVCGDSLLGLGLGLPEYLARATVLAEPLLDILINPKV